MCPKIYKFASSANKITYNYPRLRPVCQFGSYSPAFIRWHCRRFCHSVLDTEFTFFSSANFPAGLSRFTYCFCSSFHFFPRVTNHERRTTNMPHHFNDCLSQFNQKRLVLLYLYQLFKRFRTFSNVLLAGLRIWCEIVAEKQLALIDILNYNLSIEQCDYIVSSDSVAVKSRQAMCFSNLFIDKKLGV